MPTALILEDGTNVEGANTFVALTEVVKFCADRALTFTGTQAQQEANVIEAGEYLQNEERYRYRGLKTVLEQTMPWPRAGAKEFRGPAIPSDGIPWRVKQAQCFLSYLAGRSPGSLQKLLERGGRIHSKKVDVLETVFESDAPVETTIQRVQGVLAPILLKTGYRLMGGEVYAAPVDADPFKPGEFNNQNSTTNTLG